ncbi:hypothetical protein DPMN_171711 [Dreissena polymorpha]|uniref:Uncharacterized protein n=1 Tax=Dreissena polymorpha TaxID=45954 RepID=A0A9D4DYH6_DREPO|nr:hypothetical protein DPMN_171711 [Dreissena polymorpha]
MTTAQEEEVMFTNVINALCSEVIGRTDGHPLAEYFVITDNGNLGQTQRTPPTNYRHK